MKEGQKFLAPRLSGERVFKAKNNLVNKQAVRINSQQNRSKNENVSQELSYAYRKKNTYSMRQLGSVTGHLMLPR